MRQHGELEDGEIRNDEEEDVHLEMDNSNIHPTELHNIQATSIEQINSSPKNKINCKVVEYDDSSEEMEDVDSFKNMENNVKVTNITPNQNESPHNIGIRQILPPVTEEKIKDSIATSVITRNQVNLKRVINQENDPKVRKKPKLLPK